jgi:hypothetical protein
MSAARCGHCGARSTIWLPTCAFCGHAVSSASLPTVGVRSAVFDAPPGPCTERRAAEARGGWFDLLRAWWARLTQRPAATRP